MPVVQIKDSDQKIKFPDQMSQDQILNALKRQYPTPVSQKIDDALSKPESTISNRDVSLAENTKQKIANFLFDNKIVSDRYGAQRIGDNLSSLLGVLPGIGDAQAGDEFGKAVAEGDGLGIGIGALSALPIVGDVAAKGARKVFHGSNKQIDEYMRGVNTKGRLGAGIYFGDEKKANVFAKMAKIKKQPSFLNEAEIVSDNPKQVTEDMLLLWPQGKFPAEVFEKEGYTGIQLINQNTGEIIEETVFDPKNIKSLNKPEAKPLGDAVKEVKTVTSSFNPKAIKSKALGESLKSKYPDLSIGVRENDSNIILDKIIVPEKSKGTGTKFMNDLIVDADSKGKSIGLTPSSDFGGSKSRLAEFYKRFGFTENKGKRKDFTISESMIRKPKVKK
jgi:hypothetical protein